MVHDENWSVTFVPGTWAEGLERLQSEEIDLMVCVAYSEERDIVMDYNFEPVMELWGQVFVREKERNINMDDLQGRKVGLMDRDISGQNFIETAKQLGVECEITTYGSHGDVFMAVQKGEVFAGVAPQHYGLRNSSEYYLVPSSIIFSPFSIYFTTKEGKSLELLTHIDAHLIGWKNDRNSFYYKSVAYWMGGTKYGFSFVPRWLLVLSVSIFFLALLLLLFTLLLKREVRRKTDQIKKRDRQYEDLVKYAKSIIIRIDRAGKVLFMNPFGLEFFSCAKNEVLGHDSDSFFSEGFIQSIIDYPERKESYEHVELKSLLKSGDFVYLKWSNTVIWDSVGEFDEILSIGVDMTSSRLMEAKLRQSDKLSAIGQLAGGVAHDFNNQLLAIMGFAELLEQQLKDEDLLSYTKNILASAKSSADLTKKLLSFARKGQVVLVSLDLKEIILGVIELLQRGINKNIIVHTDFCVQSHKLLGDPSQLENALLNLLINARDAMTQGGEISIQTEAILLTRGNKSFHERIKKTGEYIKLSISDEGTGISEENQERIFEPFFTTKDQGKGTGMGLASVYGTVKEHGGYISFRSRLGRGTTFEIFLPC